MTRGELSQIIRDAREERGRRPGQIRDAMTMLRDSLQYIERDGPRRAHADRVEQFLAVLPALRVLRRSGQGHVLYDVLKHWASDLVGWSAPPDCYVDGGYDLLLAELTAALGV